jgi:hypothetical protein
MGGMMEVIPAVLNVCSPHSCIILSPGNIVTIPGSDFYLIFHIGEGGKNNHFVSAFKWYGNTSFTF